MKNPLKSKTLWVNAIVSLVALVGFSGKVSAEQVAMGLGVLNLALRLVTKDKIGFEE